MLDGLDPIQGLVNNLNLVNFVEQRLKGEIQRPVFHNSGGEIILTAPEPTQVPKPKDTLKSMCLVQRYLILDVIDVIVMTNPHHGYHINHKNHSNTKKNNHPLTVN